MKTEGFSMVTAITEPFQHSYYTAGQNLPVPHTPHQAASTHFPRDGMRRKERRECTRGKPGWLVPVCNGFSISRWRAHEFHLKLRVDDWRFSYIRLGTCYFQRISSCIFGYYFVSSVSRSKIYSSHIPYSIFQYLLFR